MVVFPSLCGNPSTWKYGPLDNLSGDTDVMGHSAYIPSMFSQQVPLTPASAIEDLWVRQMGRSQDRIRPGLPDRPASSLLFCPVWPWCSYSLTSSLSPMRSVCWLRPAYPWNTGKYLLFCVVSTPKGEGPYLPECFLSPFFFAPKYPGAPQNGQVYTQHVRQA